MRILIVAVFIFAGVISSCAKNDTCNIGETDTDFQAVNDDDAVNDVLNPDENNGPVSMSLSVTTASYGGEYSPQNVFAMWIEKEDGSYIQTLGAWAKSHKSKLQRWYSKSDKGSQGMVDSVSGASRRSHGTQVVTWKIDDIASQKASNGIYNIYFELNETSGCSETTTARIKISNTPEVLSINNTNAIKNIQITFGK